MSTAPPAPRTRPHSLRCSDEDWAVFQERAAASEMSVNAFIVSAALAAGSFSAGLRTVSVLQDHGGIEEVLALADAEALQPYTRSVLRDIGAQLQALAKRWPR